MPLSDLKPNEHQHDDTPPCPAEGVTDRTAPAVPQPADNPAGAAPPAPGRLIHPVLPDVTSDETRIGWGDWPEERDDDERLLREVPPHHGDY